MRYRTLSFAILVFAGLFSGCAFTTIQSIQRAPEFHSADMQRVLVIGHFKNQTLRKLFEEEFVRQWSRRGVQAASSLEVLPASTTWTKEVVVSIANTRGFDTVLISRLLEKKTINPGEPAVSTIVPPDQNDLQDMNTALQTLLAPPVSTSEFTLATVETNLYHVSSGYRLWSGVTETEVMKKIPKLIPPFVKLILKHLYGP